MDSHEWRRKVDRELNPETCSAVGAAAMPELPMNDKHPNYDDWKRLVDGKDQPHQGV